MSPTSHPFGLWLFRQPLYHQQNAVVHGNVHHKLEFFSNGSCSCGIRRLSGVPHTAPTLRSQVMLPMRMVQPRTTTFNSLAGIEQNSRASVSMVTSRWTRDIFLNAMCHLHNILAKEVRHVALLTPQGTAEVTTLCCSDLTKNIFSISNQTTSRQSTRATPFPHGAQLKLQT